MPQAPPDCSKPIQSLFLKIFKGTKSRAQKQTLFDSAETKVPSTPVKGTKSRAQKQTLFDSAETKYLQRQLKVRKVERRSKKNFYQRTACR